MKDNVTVVSFSPEKQLNGTWTTPVKMKQKYDIKAVLYKE